MSELIETSIEYTRQTIGWLNKKLPELDSYLYRLSREREQGEQGEYQSLREPCPPEKCPICEPTRVPRGTCRRPTPGWFCTLEAGHDGSCPAWPMHHLDTDARG